MIHRQRAGIELDLIHDADGGDHSADATAAHGTGLMDPIPEAESDAALAQMLREYTDEELVQFIEDEAQAWMEAPRGSFEERSARRRRNAGTREQRRRIDKREGNGAPGQGQGQGDGEGLGERPEPNVDLEGFVRHIAREEDNKRAQVIDRNFSRVGDRLLDIEAKLGDRVHTVRIEHAATGLVRDIEGRTHERMKDVLEAAAQGFNILLVGGAGTGKTVIAIQVAQALGKQFATISCSAGMTESALTGRLLPLGEGGTFQYAEPEFVRCYEQGGVFLLDEVDAADANVMLVLNQALANDVLPLPARIDNPKAHKHAEFLLIAAANTFGYGASRQYVGRNQLDAATVNRFTGAVIEIGYDKTLEADLVDDEALLKRFWAVREKVEGKGIRRVWSTRDLLAAYRWRKAGKTLEEALARITVGWSRDDLSNCGLPVPSGAS